MTITTENDNATIDKTQILSPQSPQQQKILGNVQVQKDQQQQQQQSLDDIHDNGSIHSSESNNNNKQKNGHNENHQIKKRAKRSKKVSKKANNDNIDNQSMSFSSSSSPTKNANNEDHKKKGVVANGHDMPSEYDNNNLNNYQDGSSSSPPSNTSNSANYDNNSSNLSPNNSNTTNNNNNHSFEDENNAKYNEYSEHRKYGSYSYAPPHELNPDSNIYVANLPSDYGEANLHKLFSAYGTIIRHKFVPSDEPDQPGYGFVQFLEVGAAKHAIKGLEGTILTNNQPLYISVALRRRSSLSDEPTNLYIKNLPDSIDGQNINDIFRQFGKIRQSRVVGEGVAFVRFETHLEAIAAIDHINEIIPKGADGNPVEVRFAHRKTAANGYRSHQVTQKNNNNNLYIRNLPENIAQSELEELFSRSGKISSSKLCGNGIAFVRFLTHEEGAKAIRALNGKKIQGCKEPLIVKFAYFDIGDARNRLYKPGSNQYNLSSSVAQSLVGSSVTPDPYAAAAVAAAAATLYSNFNVGLNQPFATVYNQFGIPQTTTPVPSNDLVSSVPQNVAVAHNAAQQIQGLAALQQQTQQQQQQQVLNTAPFLTSLLASTTPTPVLHNDNNSNHSNNNNNELLAQMQQWHLAANIPNNIMTVTNNGYANNGFNLGLTSPGGSLNLTNLSSNGLNLISSQTSMPKMDSNNSNISNNSNKQETNLENTAPEGQQHDNANFSQTQQKLGDAIYAMLETKYPQFAGKITGMILKLGEIEAKKLIDNPEQLQKSAAKAYDVLKNTKPNKIQQQHNQQESQNLTNNLNFSNTLQSSFINGNTNNNNNNNNHHQDYNNNGNNNNNNDLLNNLQLLNNFGQNANLLNFSSLVNVPNNSNATSLFSPSANNMGFTFPLPLGLSNPLSPHANNNNSNVNNNNNNNNNNNIASTNQLLLNLLSPQPFMPTLPQQTSSQNLINNILSPNSGIANGQFTFPINNFNNKIIDVSNTTNN